tara:strand:- start:328 stop:636 length:309 start_codon:yes stop_codon:yes gene_type:complete
MVDKKAKTWAENNKWFGKKKSLTLAALYFHEQLVDMNVNPRSKRYYDLINLIMEPYVSKKIIFKSKPKRRRTVKLTLTQIDIARKLRVPLKAYTNQLNSVEW